MSKLTVPMHKRLHDRRIKKVITFDTETAPFYEECEPYKTKQDTMPYQRQVFGSLDTVEERFNERRNLTEYHYMTAHRQRQIIFDFGYVVGDKHGNVLKEQRFIIREVFLNMEIMKHAHYFAKFPDYIEELYERRNVIKMVSWLDAKSELEKDLLNYEVSEMYAYNAAFDSRAIAETHRIITHGVSRFTLFKDYQIKLNCIWGMACETILQRDKYIKFCIDNGFVSSSGNIKTSAETVYRYLINDPEYVEEHTALEDSIIEHEILAHCFKAKQKMSFGIINQPWLLVKKYAQGKGLI